MTEKRKLFRPKEGIVLGVIVLICAAALLWIQFGGAGVASPVAEISCDGEIVRRIQLDTAESGPFDLAENDKVHFEISNGRIRFVGVDCPDKLCENEGWLERPNQLAVCLPNRVSVRIVAAGAEVDAIVN